MDYEFKVLIAKAQADDKDSVEQIINKYKYLINIVTKKMRLTYNNSIEDFNQIGSIGLLKAIRTYEANKEVKFSTYSQKLITNEIITFLRTNKKTYLEVYNYLDNIQSTYNESDKIDNLDLYNAVNKLNFNFRNVIKLLFFNSLTQEEVANRLNIDRSYVSKMKTNALMELKKHLTI